MKKKRKSNQQNKSLVVKNKQNSPECKENDKNINNFIEEVKENVEEVKEEVNQVKGIMIEQSIERSVVMIPFIPPNILKEYKDIDPSLVDFFKDQINVQRQQRFKYENDKNSTQNFIQKAGLCFGFILGLISITGSLILVGMGFDIQGLSVLGTSFASIIGISAYGIYKSKKEKKAQNIKGDIKEFLEKIREKE